MELILPLKQGEDAFCIYVEDACGRIIADVRAPAPIVGETVDQNMERHRRVARVFAAAPKMLALLKQIQSPDLVFSHQDAVDLMGRIDAVIAEVERP